MDKAAIKIQSRYRGNKGRERFSDKKESYDEMNDSALKI